MSKWLGTTDIILTPQYWPSPEEHARVLNAVVGLISRERGEEHTKKFIIDFIMPYLQDKHIFEMWEVDNGVDLLKKILHNSNQAYEPRLQWETGRNTIMPCFVVGLYVNKELIGSGKVD